MAARSGANYEKPLLAYPLGSCAIVHKLLHARSCIGDDGETSSRVDWSKAALWCYALVYSAGTGMLQPKPTNKLEKWAMCAIGLQL